MIANIMTWNYRILKIGDEFGMHEIFYDEAANAISFTEQKVSPRGCSLDEFHADFLRFQDALNKPVLMVTKNEKIVEFSHMKSE